MFDSDPIASPNLGLHADVEAARCGCDIQAVAAIDLVVYPGTARPNTG